MVTERSPTPGGHGGTGHGDGFRVNLYNDFERAIIMSRPVARIDLMSSPAPCRRMLRLVHVRRLAIQFWLRTAELRISGNCDVMEVRSPGKAYSVMIVLGL